MITRQSTKVTRIKGVGQLVLGGLQTNRNVPLYRLTISTVRGLRNVVTPMRSNGRSTQTPNRSRLFPLLRNVHGRLALRRGTTKERGFISAQGDLPIKVACRAKGRVGVVLTQFT